MAGRTVNDDQECFVCMRIVEAKGMGAIKEFVLFLFFFCSNGYLKKALCELPEWCPHETENF